MRRVLKNILFIILGFLLCYGLLTGLTIFRVIKTPPIFPETHDSLNASKEEIQLSNQLRCIYRKRDLKTLNDILNINAGEIELIVHGAESFPTFHRPVAEIVIKNVSKRRLVFFKPRLTPLALEASPYDGYLKSEFSFDCPYISLQPCIILNPKEEFSMPVMFDVAGLGRHKINLCIGFPIYGASPSNSFSVNTPIIARTHYIFEIVENTE